MQTQAPTFEIREDHIGIFYNYINEELIDKYIEQYNYAETQGLVMPRNPTGDEKILKKVKGDFALGVGKPAHLISDHSVDTIGSHFYLGLTYFNKPFIQLFFNKIYPIYTKKYSLLESHDSHTIYDMKIQKTIPGEGYHEWHVESAKIENRNRLMAFTLYLNDVEEGGETEFLYQKCRFKPKRNTLLIWPANYTHAHRGNPPLSNDKYILTGWIEYGP
mgnify:CR=1 FL=1